MFNFSALSIPLIQAPMAGGPNTPEMISTVANSGGVGSYGFAYSTPEKIDNDLRAASDLRATSKPGAVNVNFFVFSAVEAPSPDELEGAIEALNDASDLGEIMFTIPKPPFFPDLEKQLEPVWDHKPEILTFHLGLPDPQIVEKAHSLGIAVGMSATCSDEAKAVEAAGADFIVAQGIEAGGHRGIFDIKNDDEALSVYELVSVLSTNVGLPVVAAGGISTREDVVRALDCGATAVQLGTLFLTTQESGASPAHKRYLLNETARESTFTFGFSGRPARGIDNKFIQSMKSKSTLEFPLQNTLTAGLRSAAAKEDNGETQSLWAGANFRHCREESIDDLIKRLFDLRAR
ncbi:MAG: nitronate monooxygenase [Pseudomonadota bacterium]